MTIEWTRQAAQQLANAYDYIARTNSANIAADVEMRIVSSVEMLAVFPQSGRSGRVKKTRELVVPDTPFIAAYTVEKDHIVVLAIYHGAQRWPESL